MLIRSQNKKILTKFDTLEIDTYTRKDVNKEPEKITNIIAYTKSGGRIVGTYSTKEKAVKVLDMIQEEYLKTTEILLSRDIVGRCLPKAVVFQMPQDEEIEDG